jgi:hypothetical protein
MLLKNIIISLLPLFVYGRKAAFQQELRRQYDDFKNRLNKVETPLSFETFVYNLNTIENFNEEKNGCRMYLTQNSDVNINEVYTKCNERNEIN